MKRTGIYILVFLLTITVMYIYNISEQQDMMADKLLRLHVIANSDDPADQELKLKVKDRIVEEIRNEISGMASKEQVIAFINDNKYRIEQIAREQIIAWGKDYDVKIETGNFVFPTKLYGNLALPAGKYDALEVVIGKGKGANWWCVMFPPLCFVDSNSSVAFASDQQRVKEMLEEEEYEILSSSQNCDQVPIRIRFKIIELLNKSRIKMAEVLRQK